MSCGIYARWHPALALAAGAMALHIGMEIGFLVRELPWSPTIHGLPSLRMLDAVLRLLRMYVHDRGTRQKCQKGSIPTPATSRYPPRMLFPVRLPTCVVGRPS